MPEVLQIWLVYAIFLFGILLSRQRDSTILAVLFRRFLGLGSFYERTIVHVPLPGFILPGDKEIERTDEFSSYAVRAKMNLGSIDWGHRSSTLTLSPSAPTRMMNRFVKDNGYRTVWPNPCFEILKRFAP